MANVRGMRHALEAPKMTHSLPASDDETDETLEVTPRSHFGDVTGSHGWGASPCSDTPTHERGSANFSPPSCTSSIHLDVPVNQQPKLQGGLAERRRSSLGGGGGDLRLQKEFTELRVKVYT